MDNYFKLSFSIISIILFINLIEINAQNKVSVKVNSTEINGFVQEFDKRKLNVFLGIPYAKPPVGELSFKKPVDYVFDKPINALTYGNPCLQSISVIIFNPLLENKNLSEDCLYLNIWSPVEENTTKAKDLKPVLFWIHGGALVLGASNWEKTPGEVLAAKGDIVVVTINYRLAQFGFLYTGTDKAPGNVGLWDQAMALKWVNENIKYFGGDPNQITIMGESAGSQSVSLHLLSPISRNLFKNAIMMSGSALADFIGDKDSVKKMWSEMAEKFKCKQDFDLGGTECMRNISVEFAEIAGKALVIYGNEFLPQKPSVMLKTGDYKKNVNLLMGTTDDEGSLILSLVDPKVYSLIGFTNLSKSDAKTAFASMISLNGIKSKINSDDVYKLYSSQLPEGNYDAIRKSLGVGFGDYILGCPTIEFGKLLFSGDRNKSRVYQYLWSAKYTETWHGADHATDVEYFFGSPFRETKTTNENKRKVSEKLISVVSHFVRNGNPPPQEDIEWNSYFMIGDELIAPYYEFANNIKTNGNFGFGFKYECSKLWKNYIITK